MLRVWRFFFDMGPRRQFNSTRFGGHMVEYRGHRLVASHLIGRVYFLCDSQIHSLSCRVPSQREEKKGLSPDGETATAPSVSQEGVEVVVEEIGKELFQAWKDNLRKEGALSERQAMRAQLEELLDKLTG